MSKKKDCSDRFLSFLISLIPKIKNSREINDLLLNLPRFYLNENLDIALESIKASGIDGNIFAVEKLFNVIDEGETKVKIQAIKALNDINPPLIHERLIEYYNLLSENEVKIEILKLLNERYYKNKEVINFNRSIVSDNNSKLDFKTISVSGLVKSKDFSFLSFIFPHGESRLIEEVLVRIIKENGIEVEEFLKKQTSNLDFFSDRILGYYLCAYTLKVGGAKVSILNRISEEKNVETLNSYLDLCQDGIYFSDFTKRLFRILLSFPILNFSDEDSTETKVRKLLKIIIDIANNGSINDIKELTLTCNVQLTSLFKNLKLSHISLSNVKSKGEFYYRFLAQLFEKLLPVELLDDVIHYFSGKNLDNASLLVSTLMQFAKTQEEKRLIEACVPLFYENDERKRLQIYTILKKVNPDIKAIVGRIARIIYSLYNLKVKSLGKKIEEIYRYSIDEKLQKIEAESIVALSVIKNSIVRDRIKSILMSMKKENIYLIKSALEAIKSLPASDIDNIITEGFIAELDDGDLLKLLLENLASLSYKLPNKSMMALINSMNIFEKHNMLNMVIDVISEKGNHTIFNPIKSYVKKKLVDIDVKIACIEILRGLKRKDTGMKPELIINFLYSLLEEREIENKEDLYSSIISFLLELNDDYSFKIFETLIDKGKHRLVLKILEKLPYRIVRKIFVSIMEFVKNIDSEGLHKIKNYFYLFPEEFFDNSMKNHLIDNFMECIKKGKSFKVSENINAAGDNISLIERPKVEFRIRYEQTKEVAVFFIDIANYTTLSSKLNLTGLMKLVSNFEKIVISTVEDFNGRIIKKMGDGILAVFNHPLNSVIAGMIIQEKIKDFNDFVPVSEKFRTRIGIHSGSVVFKDNDIFGDTVNVASRIESMADPGHVLVSENVYNLTKDFIKYSNKGPLKLKGISVPVNSYVPESLTKNLMKYLEIKDSNRIAAYDVTVGSDIDRRLRVIMFNPNFIIPKDLKIKYDLKDIKKIFESFSKYVESFAKDYLEEYEIKAWLQNKWKEILIKTDDF